MPSVIFVTTLIIFAFIKQLREFFKIKNYTQQLQGEVVDIKLEPFTRRRGIYGAHVAFIVKYTYFGTEYTSKCFLKPEKMCVSIGNKVKIYIDPKNPEDMYITKLKKKHVYGYIGVAMAIAAMFIFMAVKIPRIIRG